MSINVTIAAGHAKVKGRYVSSASLLTGSFWVRRSMNALLIQIVVETVWHNVDSAWDAYLASPADFAGADDIITNLVKEREPGSRSSNALQSLIITSYNCDHV